MGMVVSNREALRLLVTQAPAQWSEAIGAFRKENPSSENLDNVRQCLERMVQAATQDAEWKNLSTKQAFDYLNGKLPEYKWTDSRLSHLQHILDKILNRTMKDEKQKCDRKLEKVEESIQNVMGNKRDDEQTLTSQFSFQDLEEDIKKVPEEDKRTALEDLIRKVSLDDPQKLYEQLKNISKTIFECTIKIFSQLDRLSTFCRDYENIQNRLRYYDTQFEELNFEIEALKGKNGLEQQKIQQEIYKKTQDNIAAIMDWQNRNSFDLEDLLKEVANLPKESKETLEKVLPQLSLKDPARLYAELKKLPELFECEIPDNCELLDQLARFCNSYDRYMSDLQQSGKRLEASIAERAALNGEYGLTRLEIQRAIHQVMSEEKQFKIEWKRDNSFDLESLLYNINKVPVSKRQAFGIWLCQLPLDDHEKLYAELKKAPKGGFDFTLKEQRHYESRLSSLKNFCTTYEKHQQDVQEKFGKQNQQLQAEMEVLQGEKGLERLALVREIATCKDEKELQKLTAELEVLAPPVTKPVVVAASDVSKETPVPAKTSATASTEVSKETPVLAKAPAATSTEVTKETPEPAKAPAAASTDVSKETPVPAKTSTASIEVSKETPVLAKADTTDSTKVLNQDSEPSKTPPEQQSFFAMILSLPMRFLQGLYEIGRSIYNWFLNKV